MKLVRCKASGPLYNLFKKTTLLLSVGKAGLVSRLFSSGPKRTSPLHDNSNRLHPGARQTNPSVRFLPRHRNAQQPEPIYPGGANNRCPCLCVLVKNMFRGISSSCWLR